MAVDGSFKAGVEDMRIFGLQVWVAVGAAAPVYMLAAWRWSVEWPSGGLSNVFLCDS